MLKKVVIIGPESTGKSTLCEKLAQHYNTLWCPEYAREYLLSHGMNYSYDDLLTIAKGQIALENEYIQKVSSSRLTTHDSLLFLDTDMYVMKVWCEFVFQKCHRFILEQIAGRNYDLYLLCKNDLPWVKDELREYPNAASRDKLFSMYRDLMINQPTPWVEIAGDPGRRFVAAKAAVNNLLKK